MIPLLPMLLAAIISIPGEPPATADTLAERLIAALPDGAAIGAIDGSADPAELARLETLNPGRSGDIARVLETYAVCESTMRGTMMRRGIARIAAELGESKVERLIAFYRDEDAAEFVDLAKRIEQGETLSDAEQAAHDRIAGAYPILEFAELMRTSLMTFMLEGVTLAELGRCQREKEQALDRLGLRGVAAAASEPEAPSVGAE